MQKPTQYSEQERESWLAWRGIMAGVDRTAHLGIDGSQVNIESEFGNVIVVDHLPTVPKEKFEELASLLKKIYNQLGVIKEKGLGMPVDPVTKRTLGYCFIEFNTPQEAQNAKAKTHGYNIFPVNTLDDFERLVNESESEKWKIRWVMKWKKLHQEEKLKRQNL